MQTDSEKRLAGRVAVVSGAANGLGQAYAIRLARDGARVVVADVLPGHETVDAISASGGEAVATKADVSSEDDVASLRDLTLEHFGACDILVNNAGVFPIVRWDDLDFATWQRVLKVNLDSMFLMSKAFAPGMCEQGWGRIINISSSTFAAPVPGFVHYVSSKGGVIGFTRALSRELGEKGVTVNCILPGLTMTPSREGLVNDHILDHITAAQAIKRRAVPDDLQGAVAFFASEDARWVTGQALLVDGGQAVH